MRYADTGRDVAPPEGIPRPPVLVRFFDETGQRVTGYRFTDGAAAEQCAADLLGMETSSGLVIALARFYVADGAGGWVHTEDMEY